MLFHCDSQCDAYPVSVLNSSLFSEFCYSVIWNFQSGYFTVNALNYSWIQFCHSVWFKVVISQSLLWIAHGFSFATLCDSKVVISQSLLWITHGFSFASQSVILKFQSRFFTVVALSVWIVHLWDSCCDSMTACIKPLYVCPTRVTWQVFQFAGFYWGYNKSGVCV